MSSQLGRIPGGISPLGWLPSLHDLKVYNIRAFSVADLMNSILIREAWIVALIAVSIWLLTRPQANLQAFLTQMMLVMVVWYLSAPWASEPNVLVYLCLLLMIIATNSRFAERYFRVYWIVSGITLAFVLFNVPATSFAWPVTEYYFHRRAFHTDSRPNSPSNRCHLWSIFRARMRSNVQISQEWQQSENACRLSRLSR